MHAAPFYLFISSCGALPWECLSKDQYSRTRVFYHNAKYCRLYKMIHCENQVKLTSHSQVNIVVIKAHSFAYYFKIFRSAEVQMLFKRVRTNENGR